MSRRPFRLTMVEPSESQILAGVKTLLDLHPAVAWWARVNSGKGYLLRVDYDKIKRLIASGAIDKDEVTWIEFGAPGISDTVFQLKAQHGGRFGAIEVKKHSGRVRAEQESFLANVIDAGGVAGIARSVTDAQKIVECGVRVTKLAMASA